MTASSAYGVRYRSVPETIAFFKPPIPVESMEKDSRGWRLFFGFFEIDHPIDTKLICQRPTASAPERILQRHRDFTFFSQCFEECFRFRQAVGLQADREVVPLPEGCSRKCVGCHQSRRAFCESRMHDTVSCFLWNVAWSLGEWRHLQLAFQALLVKLHRFPAVSIKVQICNDFFHNSLREIRLMI